jgi:hypothetical protein
MNLYGVLFYVRLIRNVKAMLRISLVLLCLLTLSVPASAAVIISVQSASVTAGGTGVVDVLISSTLASENLYSAGYEFEITGSSGNGSLIFRPTFDIVFPTDPLTQSNSEQDELLPYPYVFATDKDPLNFFANQMDPVLTRLQGGDSTGSGNNVTLSTTPMLLARLELQHVSATPLAAVGDTFTISLINSDNVLIGDVSDDSTLFMDDAMNPLPFASGSDPSAFANFGTITITSAAVPEPSTFAIMAVVGAGVVGRKLRRKRAMQVEIDESCIEG